MSVPETFPLLQLPDLVGRNIAKLAAFHTKLALRQVCRTTKSWTDYLPIKYSCKSNEAYPLWSFTCYLCSGLPFVTSYAFPNIEGPAFYAQPEATEFFRKFGSNITKLEVQNFNLGETDEELQYFQQLPNLTELITKTCKVSCSDPRTGNRARVPSNFKNLRTLTCRKMLADDPHYFWMMIRSCRNLETLYIPNFYDTEDENRNQDSLIWLHILSYLTDRCEAGVPVKFLDLQNMFYIMETAEVPDFLKVMQCCKESGAKILNLCPTVLFILENPVWNVQRNLELFSETVFSLEDIGKGVETLRLPNLEQIHVKSKDSYYDINFEYENIETNNTEWPGLKRLSVTFNSETYNPVEVVILRKIIDVLFRRNTRPSVTDLKLMFARDRDGNSLTEDRDIQASVYRSVRSHFGGVKRLELQGWDGVNKWFIRLWEEMWFLEQIVIDDCHTVGNVVFIGTDENNPVFLKLTRLTSLSLKSLEKMPKITDRVFRDVFKNMKLQEFVLRSDSSLTSITQNGIIELAGSPAFADSIKRFPFWGWSLKDVDRQGFVQLRDMFKCN